MMQRVLAWLRHGYRRNDGVSAVEFALFAPVLFFALLATTDIGLALYERMTIDHVLRAGAQSAMADQGEGTVRKVLEATAVKHFSLASGTASSGSAPLNLSVTRQCACAENPNVAVTCATTCSDSAPTQIFYRLAAAKGYTGMVLPVIRFSPSLQVQIR